MNPELRQTLHTITRNFESANEAAQENIYTFTQLYIDPCLTGFKSCLRDFTAPCFPSREEQLRRKRGRSRGRAELSFDFYDEWEEDEDAGNNLLSWGNDELDSLLAGSSHRGARNGQPQRQRAMSYGSRGRRRNNVLPTDNESDPTVIPSSAYLGFLERLPWKFGGRVLRYKPSAADLQENPGGLRIRDVEAEPLIEASDDDNDDGQIRRKGHGRQRSETNASRSTTNSLSSRGDLIPSDEEDDAVPLGDEFSMALERRTTNAANEDRSSGKTGSTRRPDASRRSMRTASSKSSKSTSKSRTPRVKHLPVAESTEPEEVLAPILADLKKEEDQVRTQEEEEVERKRDAAKKLAAARGLSSSDSQVRP